MAQLNAQAPPSCVGFALLKGPHVHYIVQKPCVTIAGRQEGGHAQLESEEPSLPDVLLDSDTVPRVGGPRIEYDMDRELFVLRGGPGGDVRVDDRAVPPEVTVPLRSQSLVRVGDREFYFLLPRGSLASSRARAALDAMPPAEAGKPEGGAAGHVGKGDAQMRGEA